VDPGSQDQKTVISGILRFSLKFTCSHFLHKCHFCVNYVEFMFMMRIGIHDVLLFRSSGALSVEFSHFTDSSRNGVLGGALGSSLEGSFLAPRITYF